MTDSAQVLRDEIEKSGISQYRLSIDTGVAQGAISQFMNGRNLHLKTFDKLANSVGLVIRAKNTRDCGAAIKQLKQENEILRTSNRSLLTESELRKTLSDGISEKNEELLAHIRELEAKRGEER